MVTGDFGLLDERPNIQDQSQKKRVEKYFDP